jgi:protein-S-isoprenylcysteine O-methyltransferase Ste14
VLLVAMGAAVRVLALWEFRRHRASLVPERWVPSQLVETGIYRFVRHPMYLADVLVCTGWYCLWRAWYALCLIAPVAAVGAWLRGYLEDQYIHEPAFGETYRAYRRRTGMFLPRIRRR